MLKLKNEVHKLNTHQLDEVLHLYNYKLLWENHTAEDAIHTIQTCPQRQKLKS